MAYRVVQWATGAMGTATLRTIIDRPETELAGVLVYSDHKAGQDAGQLARRPETGVLATRSAEEILELDADVVVHAARLGPYGSHDADLVALLESGKNVITVNGYSHPCYWGKQRLATLEDACVRGGSTLVAAGLNPGFVGEQLAVTASGLCIGFDHLEIVEHADSRAIRRPEYLFDVLGFGADPATHDPNDGSWNTATALDGMYEEVLATIAHRLNLPLDRVETDHRLFTTDRDVELPAGVVPRGTVSHTNWRWHGLVHGKPTLTMSIHWYIDTTHLEHPDPPLWAVTLTGHPSVRMTVGIEKHTDDNSRMSAEQYALAGAVVNAIPHVYAAPPGPLTRPLVTPFRSAQGSE